MTDGEARLPFRGLRCALEHLRQREDFDAIAAIVDATVRAAEHPSLVVAALRLTFLYRDLVPGWHGFVAEAAARLEQHGHDADAALVGLRRSA